MRKVATDIEQGDLLISLGIDPEKTADMRWERNRHDEEYRIDWLDTPYHPGLFSDRNRYTRPAWSLEALIGLLPEVITINGSWFHYRLRVEKERICYVFADDDLYHFSKCDYNDSMIDAAVAAIKWVAEKGFLRRLTEAEMRYLKLERMTKQDVFYLLQKANIRRKSAEQRAYKLKGLARRINDDALTALVNRNRTIEGQWEVMKELQRRGLVTTEALGQVICDVMEIKRPNLKGIILSDSQRS